MAIETIIGTGRATEPLEGTMVEKQTIEIVGDADSEVLASIVRDFRDRLQGIGLELNVLSGSLKQYEEAYFETPEPTAASFDGIYEDDSAWRTVVGNRKFRPGSMPYRDPRSGQ